jgi:hypothetical protein
MAEESATLPQQGNARRTVRSRIAGRRWVASVLADAPLALREVVIVAALLSLLGLIVLGPYISRGGFYSDDWQLAAWTKYPPHQGIFGTLDSFDSVRYRPGQYIYDPIIHTVLGLHVRAFLAWAAFCAVALSVAFYTFLRFHRIGRVEAGAAAALTLLFPYSSSTRLWSTSAVVSITIILYLVGTLLVLRALSGRSRYPWVAHAIGFALVLAGVMTYEIVAPAVFLSVFLYARVTTRRRAVVAWLVDVVVVGLILIFVTSGRNQPIGTFGAQLHHAKIILLQGADLWSRVLVPYGIVPTRLAMGVLVSIAAIAAVVAALLPRAHAARQDLIRWLGILAIGVVTIALGYAMYVPADVYYSPSTLGVGDRTNGFAMLGWVLVVVALARLLATLVFRDLAYSRFAVGGAVALATLLVGFGYADRLRSEADAYAASWKDQTAILGVMKQTLPNPPHGSTIFLVRNIPWAAPGVPVFVQPWELLGTVKILYDDPSLSGYPIASAGLVLNCNAKTISPNVPAFGPPVPYGHAFVTDIGTLTTTAITSAAVCRRVTKLAGVAGTA